MPAPHVHSLCSILMKLPWVLCLSPHSKDLETESTASLLLLEPNYSSGSGSSTRKMEAWAEVLGEDRWAGSDRGLLRSLPRASSRLEAAGPHADQPADQQVLEPQPGGPAQGSRCPDHADLGPKAAAAPFWPQALGSVPASTEAPFHPSHEGEGHSSAHWVL